ncbi:MAG TPA: UDP-N-acetylglucosamine 2-epimerase (non-hydrolyzing) [Acidothermaceae bacterium]|nr:UDP-N-acetylglucosamine 2-epimerase (non-hydrolyzing) [Acidothermaceae bacterium]
MSVLTIVGARPQFIKAAPVSAALAAAPEFREIVVHTGQHFDREMSDVFFSELQMSEPAFNLGVHGGRHGEMTGRMLVKLEELIDVERPDWVLVYGDTNSTLAGALAAAKLHVCVAHVEAGLRSFNREMPEEINRVLADHVSDLLFCPTRQASANLEREGITTGVYHVGDVMYDASLAAARRAGVSTDVLKRLDLISGTFAVATVHRAETVDIPARLAEVVDYLKEEAVRRTVVFPVHPRTRQAIARFGIQTGPLRVCPPLSYFDMARLLANCTKVLTDSGGLQKEAYFHGKPCVTLRDETEWLETVDCGWNRLWRGPDYRPRRPIADYGDGRAAERIVQLLREHVRQGTGAAGGPHSSRAGSGI